jgi:hypothetical protein
LRRIAAIIGLLVSLVSQGGCARTRPAINSLWQQVPPVRWPSRDSHAETKKSESVAEPAVAANVALKKDGDVDSSKVASSIDTKPKSGSGPFGLRLTPPEPQTNDVVGHSEFNEPANTSSQASNESGNSNSPLDRLNAALTDDVQHTLSLPQRSVTMLEERVRVDSLISRAKELLEIGQLDRARDAALAAVEIGDAAQIEYSPDEDRPVDLVRRIEGQMEATRLTQEASFGKESAAAVSPPQEPDSTPLATTVPNPPEKDLKGPSRMQRSWSTLFRREKKPSVPFPADPVTQTSSQGTPRLPDNSPGGAPTIVRPILPGTHDAVVMANRSISLGSTESASESAGAFARGGERVRSDSDSFNAPDAPPIEPEVPDAEEDRESPLVIPADPSIPLPEPDDGVAALPDLETLELAPSSPKTDSSIDEEIRPEVMDDSETVRQSDWTYLYVAIGICSLLAFACYRRGAT